MRLNSYYSLLLLNSSTLNSSVGLVKKTEKLAVNFRDTSQVTNTTTSLWILLRYFVDIQMYLSTHYQFFKVLANHRKVKKISIVITYISLIQISQLLTSCHTCFLSQYYEHVLLLSSSESRLLIIQNSQTLHCVFPKKKEIPIFRKHEFVLILTVQRQQHRHRVLSHIIYFCKFFSCIIQY